MRWLSWLIVVLLGAAAAPAAAQIDYAARLTEGDVVLRDFRFASGETLPELRIHYATLGTPQDVTLQELRMETFFPIDDASDAVVRALATG